MYETLIIKYKLFIESSMNINYFIFLSLISHADR